jgi:hypothetical protein
MADFHYGYLVGYRFGATQVQPKVKKADVSPFQRAACQNAQQHPRTAATMRRQVTGQAVPLDRAGGSAGQDGRLGPVGADRCYLAGDGGRCRSTTVSRSGRRLAVSVPVSLAIATKTSSGDGRRSGRWSVEQTGVDRVGRFNFLFARARAEQWQRSAWLAR